MSVLYIVDDNELVRETLQELMEKTTSFVVRSFSSGQDFLDNVGDDACCLILDLKMPGLSGFDVLAELEKRGLTIPTIIISGHLDNLPPERSLPSFVRKFFQKPFPTGELVETVRSLVGGP
ncbi:MAG: response regulator [Planctomycetota bacterium]